MKLRDLIAAVRDYPRLREELAEAKTALETSRAECGRLEERCEVLNAAGLEQQYDLNRLQKKTEALQAALTALCPELDSSEKLRQLYECVSPFFDAEGFKLYFAAQKITGITKLYDHFPYEDARGLFEDMDGHTMLNYLTAVHFGAVDWDIVPGTTYESATIQEVNKITPEYQAFEKKLYTQVLKDLGFQSLLPSVPPKEQELANAKENCKSRGDAR